VSDKEVRSSELTYQEHCLILDEITEAGCLWLLLTGGEIFAREDFLDIYTYAKQKGLLITLFTNGMLITPTIANYLVQWPPYSIEITIYGHTKETHERVTQLPGSFERTMRAIRLIMERKLPLILKTMVLTVNRNELRKMRRFVEGDLGLQFRYDAMINPRIDFSQSPLSVRLSPQEVVELDLKDPERKTEWGKFCEHFHGPLHDPSRPDELYKCGGGLNSFAIDPTGLLSTCVLWHGDSYDLKKGSFREGWDQFLFQVSQKKITRMTKCVACPIKAMCGTCPPNSVLETGDQEAPVDFLCQVAHLRAHALGLGISPHGDCEYCPGGSKYGDIIETVTALRNSQK